MNSKMTTNSQQLTNEPKRKDKQRKQKLSKQLEQEQNQKWTSHGGISVGRRKGGMGGKVQGRSIISRHKIDGEREKWYRKQRTQRTYIYNPWA